MKISIVVEALTGTFVTDMKRAEKEAQRAAKEIEKQWKQLGVAIGAAVATAITATAALTKSAINTADATAKMAQKVGIAVESLSTLAYAATRAGADSEKLRAALTILAKNASDTAGGTGEAIKAFQALGITVTDAGGRLKGTEQLLLEVADKMAGYEDSAQKTALAVKIFGEAGANLLPFLNQGADGIAKLQSRARDLHLEISTRLGKEAEQFNDLLADMSDVVAGLGLRIAEELLPSMIELATDIVDAGIAMHEAFTEQGTIGKAIDTVKEFAELIDDVAVFLATRFAVMGVLAAATALSQMTISVAALTTGLKALTAVMLANPIGLWATALGLAAVAAYNLFDAHEDLRIATDKADEAIRRATEGMSENTAHSRAAIIVLREEAAARLEVARSALQEAQAKLQAAQKSSVSGFGLGTGVAQNLTQVAQLGREIGNLSVQIDRYNQKLQDGAVDGTLALVDGLDALGRTTRTTAPGIDGTTKAVVELWEGYVDCNAELAVLNEEFKDWTKNNEEAKRAVEQQQKAVAQYIDDLRFEVSLIGMSNQEREMAIALRRLEAGATAEQVAEVRRLIAELQKSDIIREFQNIWIQATNEIGDALTTALFDGAEAGADAIKDVMEQLARDLVRFWLQQNIVIPLQQQLAGGVSGGGGGGGSFGGAAGLGGGALGGAALGAGLGYSAGGTGGAIAGAITGYAAYVGGTAALAAYGAGTGAAASAGIGLSAGAAAVPVVGWVIAAVALLYSIFGRSDPDPRLRVGGSNFNGASKPFESPLGPLYFNPDDIRGGPELEEQMARAIQQFDTAIANILQSYSGGAEQLQEIQASLRNWTIQLHGSAITAENILGSRFEAILSTFDEDIQEFVRGAGSLEDQVQRLIEAVVYPEQLSNLMEALATGDMLASLTETERQLLQLNQQFDLVAEQAAAIGATQEQLAQIEQYRANAIERLTGAEEANLDALTRYAELAMGMTLPTGSEYQQTLAQIGQDLRSNIDALEEAARAAGLQGAREEDLGRAHLFAAQQAAQALAALESAGRDLAAQLYGSELSEIDSQIAALQSSLGGFGDAVTDVTRTIDNSINLLLGDLSPLKDRQKIPLALQALQAGQIGQEEALRIGRRVFGSGSDYNDFFAQVMQIGDNRGGGSAPVSSGPSTDPYLAQLLARRDEILAEQAEMARFGQATDLAQIIADIAGTTGQSFDEVLAGLTGGRADLAQLAEDLRLSGAEAAEEYIRTLQAASYSPTALADALRVEFENFLQGLRDVLNFQQGEGAVPFEKPYLAPGEEGDKPGSMESPIYTAPPEDPTPGELEIVDRLDRLDRILDRIAGHTGVTASGTQDTVTELRVLARGDSPFRSRSDRRGIPA